MTGERYEELAGLVEWYTVLRTNLQRELDTVRQVSRQYQHTLESALDELEQRLLQAHESMRDLAAQDER